MRKILAVASLAAALAACSAAQVQNADAVVTATASAVQNACAEALVASGTAQALVKGGATATVANLTSYVQAGCATADAVAAIAKNPGTEAWVGSLTGSLNAVVAAVNAPVAAAPAPVAAPAAAK